MEYIEDIITLEGLYGTPGAPSLRLVAGGVGIGLIQSMSLKFRALHGAKDFKDRLKVYPEAG